VDCSKFFLCQVSLPKFLPPHIQTAPWLLFFFLTWWLFELERSPIFKSSNLQIRLPMIYFFSQAALGCPTLLFPSFFLSFSFWLDGSLKLERSPFQNFTQLTCGIYLQITKLDQTIFSKYVKGCKVCL
jgi:hypothetical protein